MKSDNIIIIRYGELHLKGKNRGMFESKLVGNIRLVVRDIACNFVVSRGRYEINSYDTASEAIILDRLGCVFGLHSFSVARACATDMDAIYNTAIALFDGRGSFKIDTNRANKTFGQSSLTISRDIGQRVLEHYSNSVVDVHNPATTINIDIRESGTTYVYTDRIAGLGGLPYDTAGKGLLMLSGGIDSPVAGFKMAKRGLRLDAIHFWSYPYTSENARQKVVDLTDILSKYCHNIKLFVVPFTPIQEAIRDNCESNYMITLVRRAMMRIMRGLCGKMHAHCIVNGECLGQVASQTLDSINMTNMVVDSIPVFRPLIGNDKQEIIDIATAIGTYGTSILPYEDCCTIFMPDSPVTKPALDRVVSNESKIPNLDALIAEAIDKTYRV